MNTDKVVYFISAVYLVIIVGCVTYTNFSDSGKLCRSLGGEMYINGCARTTVTVIPLENYK